MDELISDFLTETNEELAKLDQDVVEFEHNPQDQSLLRSIFRVVHTIKGTCGFLGLSRLEAVAHAAENVLGKLRDNELTPTTEITSVIFEAIDCIKNIVAHIGLQGEEPNESHEQLIARLNSITNNTTQGTQQVNTKKDTAEPPVSNIPAQLTSTPKLVDSILEQVKREAVIEGLKIAVNSQMLAKPMQINTIRVHLDLLESLMQTVSELVLTRNQLLQLSRSGDTNIYSAPIQRLSHITSELQEKVMKTRMQPIGNAWSQFPRLVRDISREVGKKIELELTGEDTELDRQLIEALKDPLTHMIRNAMDHGIERPDERLISGKPETGLISLKSYHQGGHIVIEVADDGKGLALEKIKAKAIAKGYISEAELANVSDQQLIQFIFKPGFSTADQVTAISGRGVGMDVVKTNIDKINGSIDLHSIQGKGTTFIIKIPLTLAIMPILIIECQKEKFGIPQINITEMVRVGSRLEHQIEYINDRQVLRLRGAILPLIQLSHILGLGKPIDLHTENYVCFVVVCEVGGRYFGVIVDKIYDTEEIVVKPVTPVLKSIEIYSGSTLLGDGNVIMILDPNGLMKRINEMGHMIDTSHSHNKILENKANDGELSSFLIMRTQHVTPKAIALELVSRLEEIDVSKIEYSGEQAVIQYRENIMYLVNLDPEYVLPTEGMQQVIVFYDNDKVLGLVIEEIIDIVEQKIDIIAPNAHPGYVGSAVINGKTTELIDISYFFAKAFKSITTNADATTRQINKTLPQILLIDDSPFFRKFMPPTLLEYGYKLIAVDSAEQAWAMLEKGNKFEAIITDLNMPVVSGEEFARECYNNEKYKNLPIIALSSFTGGEPTKATTPNMIACVAKTNHEQLINVISEVVPRTEVHERADI